MGYTHYYRYANGFTAEQWRILCGDVHRILALAEQARIHVADSMGEPDTKPEINEGWIAFNGIGESGCDTFYLDRGGEEFSFCKTNYMPYDTIVVAVLLHAAELAPSTFTWSSDGDEDEHAPGRMLLEGAL